MELIHVDLIGAHPDNPRKALGDLTELTDSIQQNGVLQNLTLVHWHDAHPNAKEGTQPEHDYTCVIGHRRLAAAKAAGLTVVPCVVAEMPYRQQLATMLLENIQRSDLTVIEQAQGFQLMMDLGESVKWISAQTGFSEKTVRSRLKLNDLNQKKLESRIAQGATLMQLVELEKVANKKHRDALLEYAGTDNYNYRLKCALDAQGGQRNKAAWLERLNEFAAEVAERNYRIHDYERVIEFCDDPAAFKTPKDAKSGRYVYVLGEKGYEFGQPYATLCKVTDKAAGKTTEEISARAASRESALRKAKREANKLGRTMYQLRLDFVKQASGLKKNLPLILDWMVQVTADWELGSRCVSMDNVNVVDLMGYPVPEGRHWQNVKKEAYEKAREHELERGVWAIALARYGDGEENTFHSTYEFPKYRENKGLALFYKLLIALGYGMSDEEKQMMDGSHPLFCSEKAWEEEQAALKVAEGKTGKSTGPKAKTGRKGKVA